MTSRHVEALDITKHFGKDSALDSLDLVAESGRVTALLGPLQREARERSLDRDRRVPYRRTIVQRRGGAMTDEIRTDGSSALWGPLFGGGAREWAETWEGDSGWGGPAYEFVLTTADVGEDTRVLDCGCGAGRFAAMAAGRGAEVAGLDAAEEMIAIASERVPRGEFRMGDLEALPWPDDAFDLVTGFSSFQFAEDKVRALSEARRTSRGAVAVVIPMLSDDAGVAAVFRPVFPLFPEEGLAKLRESGIFSLSAPGQLDDVLGDAGLIVRDHAELDCPAVFRDLDEAVTAFMGAGPTALAIEHSGADAVTSAVGEGLAPFASDDEVHLPGVFRAVIATS